jgi:hypothetical protein
MYRYAKKPNIVISAVDPSKNVMLEVFCYEWKLVGVFRAQKTLLTGRTFVQCSYYKDVDTEIYCMKCTKADITAKKIFFPTHVKNKCTGKRRLALVKKDAGTGRTGGKGMLTTIAFSSFSYLRHEERGKRRPPRGQRDRIGEGGKRNTAFQRTSGWKRFT